MKLGLAALLAFLAILVTFALVEAMSLGGQMVFRMRGATADEIGWMEGLEPLRVWDAGRHARIDARYRDWAESELRAGRVDQGVRVKDGKPCEALARVAWARRGLGGEIPDVDPAIERSLAARCQEQTRASGELR